MKYEIVNLKPNISYFKLSSLNGLDPESLSGCARVGNYCLDEE